MLGSDVSVQEGEKVGEKSFDRQRVRVGRLCGEMPLNRRQVHDDRKMRRSPHRHLQTSLKVAVLIVVVCSGSGSKSQLCTRKLPKFTRVGLDQHSENISTWHPPAVHRTRILKERKRLGVWALPRFQAKLRPIPCSWPMVSRP